MHCPLCRHPKATDFFSIARVPVTCASVFDTAAEAHALPSGRIDLTCCELCGFVFNREFDAKLGEISAKYESSQAASVRFSQFARGLATEWIARYQLQGATVLEVGCGGGDFLGHLAAAGAGRVIGIDPVAVAGQRIGGEVLATAFDASQLHLAGNALVCRHTLEHVPDVHGFLTLLRRWCELDPSRVLLFELPDAERVFAERAFWDIYYEHCSYFTADTVRAAFEQAGLKVLRLTRAYDDQYLIVEAQLGTRPPDMLAPPPLQLLAQYRQFAEDVHASMQACQAAMDKLRALEPPLVLWQGAAKTVGFLASLPNPKVVDAAVDLSPQRQGKFLPGSGLPVYAPEELRRLRPKYVILMNPVYLQEVRTMVRDLGLDTIVHPVNALLDGTFAA